MQTLALIACSASKRSYETLAYKLYTGALFKKAWRYAEPRFHSVRILSALHGLVNPMEMLAPYDQAMSSLTVSQQRAWGSRTRRQLEDAGYTPENTYVTFLCGKTYLTPIQGRYAYAQYRCSTPLAGLGIGDAMHWLDSQITPPSTGATASTRQLSARRAAP